MKTATALKATTAFNGTIVNTGVLYQLFDGVCVVFGLVSQDKKQFFPVHGISHEFRFKREESIPMYPDYEIWEDQNSFHLILAEHEARKSEHPESVTNDELWDEIVQNFTPNRVKWSEDGEEGSVMRLHNGEWHILWDAHKGSKSPLFTYPIDDSRIQPIN